MASTFSLAEQGGHGMSKAFDRKTIGRTQLDLWARGNANFQEARARHTPSSSRHRLPGLRGRSDRDGREGYTQFAMPFSDEARRAIADAHEASLADHRRPSHKYSLEDFGITAAEVDAKFVTV